MNSAGSPAKPKRGRPERLVAPLVTCAAILFMLLVARFYDRMPARAPECQFRATTGLPCLGCGGTRSMRALSGGDLETALRFNPALVLGVATAFAWLAWRVFRHFRPPAVRRDSAPRPVLLPVSIGIALVLALNWIYLFFFLP